MDSINKPINLQNLSLALAKVKSDYDGKFKLVDENIEYLQYILDNMTCSLSISGNTITSTMPNGNTSSITLPVYNGGVSS